MLSIPFTAKSSGLAGYCRTGLVGRAAVRVCGTHICQTMGRIFSVRGSMELIRPEVVQRHVICPDLENAQLRNC